MSRMKLADSRQAYYDMSNTASGLVRQLAFAGIAVIWIFKTDVSVRGFNVPNELIWPGFLFVLALLLDLLHYLVGTAVWGIFSRMKEKKGVIEEKTFEAPAKINWPANGFVWSKSIAVLIGYGLLLRFLSSML